MTGLFTPQRVRALEPMIRAFVVERVERLRAEGRGDVVETLLKPLPSRVVAHFLGVPPADRAHFDRWTWAIVGAQAEGSALGAAGAVKETAGYFEALAERRRAEPGEDAISALVHGEEVPLTQILGVGFTLVTGGNDTTTGLLGGALELLTRHPEQSGPAGAWPRRGAISWCGSSFPSLEEPRASIRRRV